MKRLLATIAAAVGIATGAYATTWDLNTQYAWMTMVEPDVSQFDGTVLVDLLPDDEQAAVKNGKWNFAKAASVKWAKPSVSWPVTVEP